MNDNGKWHFESLRDYEKAKKCLMELPKEQLVDAVITGNLTFGFNDDSKTYPQRVKSYIRNISTDILFEKQRSLLDKMDENIKKAETLKGFENRIAWWQNHLEYEKISKESNDIDKKIQALLGIGINDLHDPLCAEEGEKK